MNEVIKLGPTSSIKRPDVVSMHLLKCHRPRQFVFYELGEVKTENLLSGVRSFSGAGQAN